MPKQFIVGFTESAIEDVALTVVYAENAEHALDKFAEHVGIREEKFLEYVYDRSANLAFPENFWLQDEEELEAFENDGTLLVDQDEFKRRVKEFFGQNRDFSDLYLKYHSSDQPAAPDMFPKEMLLFIWFEVDWNEVLVAAYEELPVIE
jgi:hypothetical protein